MQTTRSARSGALALVPAGEHMKPGQWTRGLGIALVATVLGMHQGARAEAPCHELADRTPSAISRLVFLGSHELPRQPGTVSAAFGGISGLDFDPVQQRWLLISDDRAEYAPGRAYPARIAYDARGFRAVELLPPLPLPVPEGERPDAEAIRLLPCRGLWAWSSEGDSPRGFQPSVRLMTPEGRPAGELSLPTNLRFANEAPGAETASGARPNLNLEGLAPTPDGSALWVAMEAPLRQDGPLPTLTAGALVRFTLLPLAGGPARQWVYSVDAIPRPATGGVRRADNGVSELLALGNGELLVVERSGREIGPGDFAFEVRIYVASVEMADEIAQRAALTEAPVRSAPKRLLLNLNELGLPRVGNVEGAAWGPRLPDGRATLLLVSDDNFVAHQATQWMLFAVEEP